MHCHHQIVSRYGSSRAEVYKQLIMQFRIVHATSVNVSCRSGQHIECNFPQTFVVHLRTSKAVIRFINPTHAGIVVEDDKRHFLHHIVAA